MRGLVIDAGVRDTSELRAMGFPVWSRHVSCQGTVKAPPGSVNVPVVLGGVVVNPGDVVCADDDGVVVVPLGRCASGRWPSPRRGSPRRTQTRARLAAGELGVDFYGLRAKLLESRRRVRRPAQRRYSLSTRSRTMPDKKTDMSNSSGPSAVRFRHGVEAIARS